MNVTIYKYCYIYLQRPYFAAANDGTVSLFTEIGERKALMWYVLWTIGGAEERTRNMINDHIERPLYTRCIVPYRRKREIHRGVSMFVDKLLFPSYVFIETDRIDDFAKCLRRYPGKNIILQTGEFFSPIYAEEEYFLTDMLGKNDIIDSSSGYLDGERVMVTSGPLRGYENRIKKVVRRKSLAILEMTLYDRRVETALGLDLISQ